MAREDGGGGRSEARAGARRGAKPKRRFRPELALLGLGAVVALAAWAVLVWLAIGYGRDARGGDSDRWVWLAGASLGAVVCLFGCLWLCTQLLRQVGVLRPPSGRRGGGRASAPTTSHRSPRP